MGIEYVPHYDESGVDLGGYTESVPDMPAKEEPDCPACLDAGCPACGRIDPADPDHQRLIAEQILLTRASASTGLGAPTDAELAAVAPGLTAEQATAIRSLTATAELRVTWPEPSTGTPNDPWATSTHP